MLFFRFVFRSTFFGWVRRVNNCCCSYSSIFQSIPKMYLFWAFQITKGMAYLSYFGCFSWAQKLPEKSRLPPSNPNYAVQGNTQGIAGQPLALLYNIVWYGATRFESITQQSKVVCHEKVPGIPFLGSSKMITYGIHTNKEWSHTVYIQINGTAVMSAAASSSTQNASPLLSGVALIHSLSYGCSGLENLPASLSWKTRVIVKTHR